MIPFITGAVLRVAVSPLMLPFYGFALIGGCFRLFWEVVR